MIGKKIKVLIALSISCSLFLSQAAMAGTTSATTSAESVTVTATQTNPQEEIKTKISRDEAIKIVKSFKFAEGYEISYINLQNDGANNPIIWRMDLNSAEYDLSVSIGISADTGELVRYYSYQNQYPKKSIVTIRKKEAREIADKFLADYVKTEDKTLEYIPNYYTYEKTAGVYEIPHYQFSYALKVNGIVDNNVTYNIYVNAASGLVTSFMSTYEYQKAVKYPSLEGIKDKNLLKEKYISSLKMQLQYLINYGNDNKPKVSIAYIPQYSGLMNAKTMDIVDDYYNYYSNSQQSINYSPIDPTAKVEKKEITEEQALEIIKNAKEYIEKLVGVKFNANENISVRLNTTDKEVNRSYYLMDGSNNYHLSISVNLNTGNIISLSFNKYNYNEMNGNQKEITEKVNYEDAKKISDEVIKKLFVKQYGVYTDNNQQPEASEYVKLQKNHTFQYARFENGISVGNMINVSVNKETGEVSDVYMYWQDIDFPKADKIISAEAAKEEYIKNLEFNLEYYIPYVLVNGNTQRVEEAVIVYAPNNVNYSKYIDAVTGKIIDYSGMVTQSPYVDENHWAAPSIEMLEAQGVSINNIKSYDEKLTRQNAVKMLSQIMGTQYFNSNKKDSFSDVNKENEYYRYIESAVQNNIIQATGKEFKGTQEITKGEFITMLIEMLGYKEIAKHEELFAKSDSSIYIAICKALNILPVKDGETFKAEDTITIAEAAYSLQKSLKYYR